MDSAIHFQFPSTSPQFVIIKMASKEAKEPSPVDDKEALDALNALETESKEFDKAS